MTSEAAAMREAAAKLIDQRVELAGDLAPRAAWAVFDALSAAIRALPLPTQPEQIAESGDGANVARLRAALIKCGRSAGAFLTDDVSTDFLMLVPTEVAGKIESLTTAPANTIPDGRQLVPFGLDREGIADLLCDAPNPRLIAEQEDAPWYFDSAPHVQEYWLSIADLILAMIAAAPSPELK